MSTREKTLSKYDAYTQTVADLFLEGLQSGDSKWIKPWKADDLPSLPHNPTTGRAYTRGNAVLLDAKQFQRAAEGLAADPTDNRWATYNQWLSVGGQVRKGEKSTRCISVNFKSEEKKAHQEKDEEPKVDQGKADKKGSQFAGVSTFDLFHASQVDGIPSQPKAAARPLDDRIQAVLDLVEKSGAKVIEGGSQAYFMPSVDAIRMPERSKFKDDMAYASVLLHELGHWTGHQSRMAREFSYDKGSEKYAKEELRVEIFSFMAAQRLGLDFDPDLENHQAYVKIWAKSIQNDPAEVVKAARDADDICEYLGVPAPTFEKLPEVERAQSKESKSADKKDKPETGHRPYRGPSPRPKSQPRPPVKKSAPAVGRSR